MSFGSVFDQFFYQFWISLEQFWISFQRVSGHFLTNVGSVLDSFQISFGSVSVSVRLKFRMKLGFEPKNEAENDFVLESLFKVLLPIMLFKNCLRSYL